MSASVTVLKDEVQAEPELEALMRNVLASFNDYVHLNRRIPDEVLLDRQQHRRTRSSLSYTIASHLILKVRREAGDLGAGRPGRALQAA